MDGSTLPPDGLRRHSDVARARDGRRNRQGRRATLRIDPATGPAQIRRHRSGIEVPGRRFSTGGDNLRTRGHFIRDVPARIRREDPDAAAPGRDRVSRPGRSCPRG